MQLRKLLTNLDNRWLSSLAILAVGLLAYSAVLAIGIPDRINQIFLANDSSLLFIGSVLLLYLAYLPSGWIGRLTSFSATSILFALQLSGLWRSGLNQSSYVLAGLLAMTDTQGYYNDALRLLEGDTFSVFSSTRPLAHGVLATLLGLTQQNLQVTFAILTLITTIACFLLAREVQRSHGTAAGVLVATTLFLFYRKYLGTASTENLGLALGTIGVAILWRGATAKRINPCLLGILLLTLALNTRAGAFFILPALLLWGAWSFRGSSRLSVRFLIGGASVVLLGFILNSLVLKAIGSPDALAYSNFSYSLYGLLVGGDWQTAVAKYPDILSLEEPARSQRVYELALEALRANPFSLVRGCMRAWTDFLWNDFIFSFVTSAKVNVTLQILSLIALVQCYRQRQTATASLIIAATIGILLSVPFVPPWDAGIRPYAATIPFIVLLPALGATFIAQKLEWHRLVQIPAQPDRSFLLWMFGFSLIILTVAGPIATTILSNPPQFSEISCPVGTEVVYFRYSPGSSINLVADDAMRKSYVPNIRLSNFRRMLDKYLTRDPRVPELVKELAKLNPNTTLIYKLDLKTKETIWAIADSALIPKESGIVGACGRRTTNPAAKKLHNADGAYLRFLFYADSMTLVSR
jgi:hypothetical protein